MGRQPRIDFYPPSSRPCPCHCPNSNQGPSFSRGQRGTSLFSLRAGPGEQEGLLEERRRRKEERPEARLQHSSRRVREAEGDGKQDDLGKITWFPPCSWTGE